MWCLQRLRQCFVKSLEVVVCLKWDRSGPTLMAAYSIQGSVMSDISPQRRSGPTADPHSTHPNSTNPGHFHHAGIRITCLPGICYVRGSPTSVATDSSCHSAPAPWRSLSNSHFRQIGGLSSADWSTSNSLAHTITPAVLMQETDMQALSTTIP